MRFLARTYCLLSLLFPVYSNDLRLCIMYFMCCVFLYVKTLAPRKKKIFADIPNFKPTPNANNSNTRVFPILLTRTPFFLFFSLQRIFGKALYLNKVKRDTFHRQAIQVCYVCLAVFHYCEESREFHLGHLDIT